MEERYCGIEKRKHKRMRVNCTVIYRANEPPDARFLTSGRDINARMLDISQTGMAMVTDYDIPARTVLSMRFTLLKVNSQIVSFSGPMEITGEVRSNEVINDQQHRLGIYFTKMRKVAV